MQKGSDTPPSKEQSIYTSKTPEFWKETSTETTVTLMELNYLKLSALD